MFIFPEHEDQLRKAGYEIERLDKPEATENELVEAVKGKVGYILGGVEVLSDKIIDAGDKLKAIVFTGIGYKDFIPNWQYATEKGIGIANTPDAPTYAVAEWALTIALAMNRNIFDLGPAGDKMFATSKGLEGQKVGIVGLGRIGQQIASMLSVFRPDSVSYYSKNRHEDAESRLGVTYIGLNDLFKESDVVFLCVSKDADQNFISAEELSLLKDGSLLVSFIGDGIVNEQALIQELKNKRIRLATDHPMKNPDVKDLPQQTLYYSKGSNAFNTFHELKLTSDQATKSILNLLESGTDKNKVN